jgi:choline dehydrogenase-like flavoprotein
MSNGSPRVPILSKYVRGGNPWISTSSPIFARFAFHDLCGAWSRVSWSRATTTSRTNVAANVRNYFHPAGTCAMGEVTDTRGRVLSTEGLVVSDASLMPTIPRANTNLSTVAIAEKIASLWSVALAG